VSRRFPLAVFARGDAVGAATIREWILQRRVLWHLSGYSEKSMKPVGPRENTRVPRTDFCFHSGMGRWRGFWGPFGDEGASDRRRFYDFTREFLLESARERAKEMAVFALVVVAAAWPVGYTVVIVIKLLLRSQPLDH
jgi:hypothetical protein